MNWLTVANKRWHSVSMTDIMSDLILSGATARPI